MGSIKLKAAATGAVCVVLGALAGIVGASAAPTSKSTTTSKPALPRARGYWRGFGPARGLGAFGPAVHADVVILNRAGTKFITVTEDSGTVQSVSGDQLTIKEAAGKVTYRTVTLTIPSGASIRRNLATVALSALKSGDRVRVLQSSDGTEVDAIDLSTLPRRPGWGPGGMVHPRFIPNGVEPVPVPGGPQVPVPGGGAQVPLPGGGPLVPAPGGGKSVPVPGGGPPSAATAPPSGA